MLAIGCEAVVKKSWTHPRRKVVPTLSRASSLLQGPCLLSDRGSGRSGSPDLADVRPHTLKNNHQRLLHIFQLIGRHTVQDFVFAVAVQLFAVRGVKFDQ